jgi:predicted metal-dependent hydrolase
MSTPTPQPPPAAPLAPVAPRVEVRPSRRRTRTVSAYRDQASDTIVVLVPARLSRQERDEWVQTMVDRVLRSERRRRPSDTDLAARAERLSAHYLDGLATPSSVAWVSNQRSRWGSCTTGDKTIRLSERLRGMPAFVIDYVLLHELTHLLVPSHGPPFWRWLERYPQTERARGYLEGFAAASGSASAAESDLEPDPGSGIRSGVEPMPESEFGDDTEPAKDPG